MNGLLQSIIHRPYVFAFLAAYLVLAWRYFGMRRTILWLLSGYAIAWASELSSIQNGFPYGDYKYVYDSMRDELMVAGVPFFDSLSYPFLNFAGFATASFILGRRCATGLKAVAFGALLTMLLDVIVDPVATMGSRWFLGQIHFYVYPGWYFGVPFSNFAGWFLVSFAIIG
ncbi:MAG: carotenoid biosynthesis protein, partial [bacterium]